MQTRAERFAEDDRRGELFSADQNHQQGLLKYGSLGPRLSVSDSVGLGRVRKFAFLTRSPRLPVQGAPFGNRPCPVCSRSISQENIQGLVVSDLRFPLLLLQGLEPP